MSDSQFMAFLLQVYDELERRRFKIRSNRAEGLDFSDYEKNVGFRKIWLSDFDVPGSHFTVNLHPGDTSTQARAYLGYLTRSKIDALLAMGWNLENNFHFSSAYGENLWEIVLNAQKSLSCIEYQTFWSKALEQGKIGRYERADFDSLFQMLEDGKVLDESDRGRAEAFFNGNKRQVANICPGISLSRVFPRSLLTDDVKAAADVVQREVTALLNVLDIPKFSLDAYLRKNMNTAKQSNSQTDGDLQKYIDLLDYKGQIILQGPPGTGKTYTAKEIARHFVLTEEEKQSEDDARERAWATRIKLVQFHPSYTYEDFVRGIVVKASGDTATYEVTNRVLGQLASEAKGKDQKYVLIIDEINRANLSAVFGELIYALEYREEPVTSMYALKVMDEAGKVVKDEAGNEREDRNLVLPENLYIIGTMNTADRSAGHIDYAMRRRFAFFDVGPDAEKIDDRNKGLFKQVRALFFKGDGQERSEFLSEEFSPSEVALGHSYFMCNDKESNRDESNRKDTIELKLQYEIKPILLEYVRDGVLKETALAKINELSA